MTFIDSETIPNIPTIPVCPPSRLVSGDIGDESSGAKSLFWRLIGLGVVLSIDGDGRLSIDAPAGVLSDDLVGLMRAHRGDLLSMVERFNVGLTITQEDPERLRPDPAGSDPEPEPLGLGPAWLCPWCRLGDRLALAEPEGLRCGRCDRLAWRFVGDDIERCDWVDWLQIDAPETPKEPKRGDVRGPLKKRSPVVDPAGRSLFDPIDGPG